MDTTTKTRLAEHLTNALDSILAAVVLAGGGGLQAHVPDDALDAILSLDPAVQEAREGVQQALQQLPDSGAVLDMEASANALAARCAEAGYRLGRSCAGVTGSRDLGQDEG